MIKLMICGNGNGTTTEIMLFVVAVGKLLSFEMCISALRDLKLQS